MIGIIGSGFALYGYLPAIVQMDIKVCLLERSREKFENRLELESYADKILWVDNISSMLKLTSTIVISIPPIEQEKLLDQLINSNLNLSLILEKPLATTPDLSRKILKRLKGSEIRYIISYSFLYTYWHTELENVLNRFNLNSNYNLKISWNFKAHHFKNDLDNWKRYSHLGGGVIRFYSIHLFPLIVNLKLKVPKMVHLNGYSENEPYKCDMTFYGSKNSPTCYIEVNCDSEKEEFSINLTKKNNSIYNYSGINPFGSNNYNNSLDDRIPILKRIISQLSDFSSQDYNHKLYVKIVNLWDKLEVNSNYVINSKW